MIKPFTIFAGFALILGVAQGASALIPEQSGPSDAQTTVHVTTPKKVGEVRMKVQVFDKDKKKVGDETTVAINVTANMTRAEKACELKDILETVYPPSAKKFVIEKTSGSVSITPHADNPDVGRVKVFDVKDKSEEDIKALETKDYNTSAGPVDLEPFPGGFVPQGAAPLPTWEDWIVFTLVGSPTGSSSTNSSGVVGVTANDLEALVATQGKTASQILDDIAVEVGLNPDLTSFIDYGSQAILILSTKDLESKGILSRDSGLDMEYRSMN